MMNFDGELAVSRRNLLLGGGALAVAMTVSVALCRASDVREYAISAHPGRAYIVSDSHSETAVGSYSKQVPGLEIRTRQGERLQVTIENGFAEETTVHWHGVRVPNAMDGVLHLTQKPIPPDETFVYEFDAVDAGTFWYHPHRRSFEQVGRGLYGPLVVEERDPIRVDRDVTWVLDDWHLTRAAEVNDEEIRAVLAFIKSTWPPEIRARQSWRDSAAKPSRRG